MMVFRLGLTGGIGSGKSTAAAYYRSLGAEIVDADAISRGITAVGGAAIPLIAAEFGDDFVLSDGALNRPKMREHVFQNKQAKKLLEVITGPLITQAMLQHVEHPQAPWQVLDIPLLAESLFWQEKVNALMVIDCETQTQISRVLARQNNTGWNRALVEQVISQQASREARRAVADVVIYNEGISLEQLEEKLHNYYQRHILPCL